jgi:hypothetical protein
VESSKVYPQNPYRENSRLRAVPEKCVERKTANDCILADTAVPLKYGI